MSHLYKQEIDGICFELREAFDFSFLKKYGRVFKVFSDQDSGNICFGVEGDKGRFFVKFAGAPTKRASISPEDAIRNLKATVPIYTDLANENLIQLIDAEKIGDGYAMIFAWTDAQCMGKMYPESHRRFMEISLTEKLRVFDAVQVFLNHVHCKGYMPIDFYDGSIMYDFKTGKTIICDVDFFRKKPCVNDMGRMWGSSRFMSPEEYVLGDELDEVTTVYTLGAVAFALFSDGQRNPEAWPLNEAAFDAARKAVSHDRLQRYASIQEFANAWKATL